jgi:hypothetical protein
MLRSVWDVPPDQMDQVIRLLQVIDEVRRISLTILPCSIAWFCLLYIGREPRPRFKRDVLTAALWGGLPLLIGCILNLPYPFNPEMTSNRDPYVVDIVAFICIFGVVYLSLYGTAGMRDAVAEGRLIADPFSLLLPALIISIGIGITLQIYIETGFVTSTRMLISILLVLVLPIGFFFGYLPNAFKVTLSEARTKRAQGAAAVAAQWPASRVPHTAKSNYEVPISETVSKPDRSAAAMTMEAPKPSTATGTQMSSAIPTVATTRKMQLKLKRSQRSTVMGKVIYILDARIEMPTEERQLIEKYRLGDLVIYDSTNRKKHGESLQQHIESTRENPSLADSAETQLLGVGKTLYRFARAGLSATAASLSLRVTVYSLIKGVHVECKSMVELLGAEEAIVDAGKNLRAYIDTATTFDGREEILEF